ncbi:DnaJ C-terminal domain-containing protein [Convivina praedatoris]|uniref:Chaperone protein DnaJ n=1 Tax=Convivina praedatoris TaxID=2880963 RepID=A0ABM9D4S0_9LACO|nr:DnaJ C-terminal domain-containing protein [Convivina sp. LMG 32447]CAH1853557.1 Chaperone protein DnaJ [Convivina sp. LMG 32447]CAH1854799.1 Chaperone protein DnaJ [Convivina sp. LMG 32447]CAH1855013.1 Chaperone protein DnaJ [Convivina sp. LMG 32447]
MNNTEFYERLGVDKNASQDEIKKAYRKLSKKYHPDLNHEPGAEDKYKDIQEAFETLGDPQKRSQYDQFGAAGAQGGFGGQGFGGFQGGQGGFSDFSDLGDIFSQMFGGGFDPNAPRKGRDLQYRMHLTFDEAIFGTEKTIKYNREADGQGQQHEVKVKVPAGVETGQQMRLNGQGESGVNGGPQGDLYVVFSVSASSEGFERDGADIYLQQDISFVSAALGDEIDVKTVQGDVKLKIPAGTQNGRRFRLGGKGAPRLHGSGHGDQFVVVNVVVPTRLNKDQKNALEEFASVSNIKRSKKKSIFDL